MKSIEKLLLQYSLHLIFYYNSDYHPPKIPTYTCLFIAFSINVQSVQRVVVVLLIDPNCMQKISDALNYKSYNPVIDIRREKLFYSIRQKNLLKQKFGCFFFTCLHNQLSSIRFIVTYQGVQNAEKGDSSDRQKMNGCSFLRKSFGWFLS